MKLVFNVPRNTFTYLVEGFLACSLTSLRNQILTRYSQFFRKLLDSPSREVRGLAHIVRNDPRSTTFTNLRLLKEKTKMNNPELYCPAKVRASLPIQTVPETEMWRLGLLTNLFIVRSEALLRVEDTTSISSMIDSLCST